MKVQNELALIVGYYFSRLDKEGYNLLGYKTFSEAIIKIGEILGVKKNTIKNMRDEFDPYHGNNRIGWKRKLRGSRLKVLQSLQNIDDNTLLEVVREILNNQTVRSTQEYEDIHTLISDNKNISSKKTAVFILRGPTGKNAESFFINYFNKTGKPVNGVLNDTRENGCGYDFEISTDKGLKFVEVKGLSAETGGILFTNKEWQTALKEQENFFLVIVKNLSGDPQVKIIQNPAKKFKPRKNIQTSIQLNWSLSNKELDNFSDTN